MEKTKRTELISEFARQAKEFDRRGDSPRRYQAACSWAQLAPWSRIRKSPRLAAWAGLTKGNIPL